eukprot:scaffold85218_cov53-Attheya_sp.AAC.2
MAPLICPYVFPLALLSPYTSLHLISFLTLVGPPLQFLKGLHPLIYQPVASSLPTSSPHKLWLANGLENNLVYCDCMA